MLDKSKAAVGFQVADSGPTTREHVKRVGELLLEHSRRLGQRALEHDASKFGPEEKPLLDRMQWIVNEGGGAKFGTPAYEEQKKMLRPMLEHHWANNRHHPEHHSAGVSGMNLLDLTEMFFDWKAAAERGNEPAMNLTAACKRYDVSPQLEAILRNTAEEYGFKCK